MAAQPLLKVDNLVKHFHVKLGAFGERSATVYALDNVDLDIMEGETLSLVGESGCGKSTTGFTILNLYKATSGRVVYKGQDLAMLDEKQMRPFRRDLQIVFQDPYSTLNPRMTVGEAIGEPILFHKLCTKAELKEKVAALLTDVGLPTRFAQRYPHELSGGQRQRVVIARALACQPKFIVCDEAISALDVSIQAQVVNLLGELKEQLGLTLLFISHDLDVVEYLCDRVVVLYLGRVMEIAPTESLYANPRHPYTRALLAAAPIPDPAQRRVVPLLQGDLPSPANPPSGCVFRTRCPMAEERCASADMRLREVQSGHWHACWRDDL